MGWLVQVREGHRPTFTLSRYDRSMIIRLKNRRRPSCWWGISGLGMTSWPSCWRGTPWRFSALAGLQVLHSGCAVNEQFKKMLCCWVDSERKWPRRRRWVWWSDEEETADHGESCRSKPDQVHDWHVFRVHLHKVRIVTTTTINIIQATPR